MILGMCQFATTNWLCELFAFKKNGSKKRFKSLVISDFHKF